MLSKLIAFYRRVETKVKAAGLVALAASVAAALLNNLNANSAMLGSLSPGVQFVVISTGPTVAVFLAGYAASHTARPDLDGDGGE